MNTAILSAGPAISDRRDRWFAIVVLGLLWIELASRLRFEWTINPQYGYGWTVPFLTGFLFWRRWQTAPVATEPWCRFTIMGVTIAAAALLAPLRLIQEANPDWRLLSWAMALLVVAISSALVYLAGGPAWLRHFAFPIASSLVAVPWPTQFE
ncbi:MAG TPA: archaeosortase/exosortase family protein, partial [Chthoniobacterales bacterium]|nr:archaeosortase/exosortase family protein [Chthoniobacterales bacterium]